MRVPQTMRAWRVHEYGQPNDVLQLDEVPVPEPGPGELRVCVQANGGFAEFADCPVESAFEMPAEIPLPDAAALYFPFHLA